MGVKSAASIRYFVAIRRDFEHIKLEILESERKLSTLKFLLCFSSIAFT